jgi:hypothetical protein
MKSKQVVETIGYCHSCSLLFVHGSESLIAVFIFVLPGKYSSPLVAAV